MKESRTAGSSLVIASPARGAAEKTLPARAKVPLRPVLALTGCVAHRLERSRNVAASIM